jgi:uncharacterized protein
MDDRVAEEGAMEEVVDRPEQSRFELAVDGQLGELVYQVDHGSLVLIHTGVPDELSGRGIGARLVRAAIARAARDGLTIVPLCPFARRWINEHPDEVGGVGIDWTIDRH